MPEYLDSLQGAQRDPDLSVLLVACKRELGTKEFFLLCLILSKCSLKPNCSKIFIYGQDCRLINKIWVQTRNAC